MLSPSDCQGSTRQTAAGQAPSNLSRGVWWVVPQFWAIFVGPRQFHWEVYFRRGVRFGPKCRCREGGIHRACAFFFKFGDSPGCVFISCFSVKCGAVFHQLCHGPLKAKQRQDGDPPPQHSPAVGIAEQRKAVVAGLHDSVLAFAAGGEASHGEVPPPQSPQPRSPSKHQEGRLSC